MQLTDIMKLEKPLASIDLETTGISWQNDRIVQIGICKLYPSGEYKEWVSLVNPGMPIPKDASDTHGITDEQINGAPSFATLAPMLHVGLSADCDLLGYNLGYFDVKLLKEEFKRTGYDWTPGRIVDGFRMAQRANPHNLMWFVEEYVLKDAEGRRTEEVLDFTAHDALHDARQTMRGVIGFFLRHPDFPRDVQKLHDMFFVLPRDPNSLDPDGKIAWRNGEASFTFGKYTGKSLREVKALDPAYLRYMLKGDFSEPVKTLWRNALEGQFPVRSV